MSDGEDSEANSQDQENLPPVSELATRKRRHIADDSAATASAAEPAQRPSREKRPRLVYTPDDAGRISRQSASRHLRKERSREDSRRSTAPTQRRAAKTASERRSRASETSLAKRRRLDSDATAHQQRRATSSLTTTASVCRCSALRRRRRRRRLYGRLAARRLVGLDLLACLCGASTSSARRTSDEPSALQLRARRRLCAAQALGEYWFVLSSPRRSARARHRGAASRATARLQ